MRALVSIAAVAATIVAVTSPGTTAEAPGSQDTRPRLLVLIVVDQFRADYVDLYGRQWTRGLHELFTNGAVFTQAVVPYGITKTCAGHSSIATGTFPSTHGMIDNDWYDRAQERFVTCTEDPAASDVAFGPGRALEHHSAARLRVPTLAEELRRQAARPPRIMVMALKARTSISLAGKGGPNTVVVWEEDSGTWATSSALAGAPSADVEAFIRAHRSIAPTAQAWHRLLPPASYLYEDSAPGEPVSAFPHVIPAPFSVAWDASPWSDAFLGDLAAEMLTKTQLGRESGTDLLAIGFTALDYVGHTYGPRSHEVQDLLARLDATIGKLIETLDRTVGRDRYVLALTSDHGVAALPEQGTNGMPGGRLNPSAVASRVELALNLELGRGSYIDAVSSSYVYFLPGVLARIQANPRAVRVVETAAAAVPGVERVYWSSDLASRTATSDATLVAMRRSYVADRSGDLAFVPTRNWVIAEVGTHHGTPYDYDTRVPLVFFGSRTAAGRYTTPATIVDVAPTLAALAGISLPRTDGRTLTEVSPR